MRRICVAILLAVMACGCSSAALSGGGAERIIEETALPFCLSGTLTLEGLDESIELTAAKNEDEVTVELTSQGTEQGLLVRLAGDTAAVSYREMQMEFAISEIPQESVFVSLRALLNALPPTGEELASRGDGIVLSGRNGMTAYNVLWSRDGNLRRIEFPGAGAAIAVTSCVPL